MKILVMPDSFKESLTSVQAAKAMIEGIEQASPDIESIALPIGDGGEGTTDALLHALNGYRVSAPCVDALERPTTSVYGITGDESPYGATAIIEISAASGLEQINKGDRDPLKATTRGTGELVLNALDRGIRSFLICLGGSATNDGGAGMLQALGVKFYGPGGLINRIAACHLSDLVSVDLSMLDPRFKCSAIKVACDVDNPLLGHRGATRVFGPQKGVTASSMPGLEAGLSRLADLLERATGIISRNNKGAGAAGGAGFALMQVSSASFHSGVDLVLDITEADQKIAWADIVMTGEGCFDAQSLNGKVPLGVAKRAEALGKPVVILCGVLGHDYGFNRLSCVSAVFPIIDRLAPLSNTLVNGETNLRRTTREIVKTIILGQQLAV